MKRIEFIAPVESMRGNLGSKQTLVYAPDNNRAFDSIEGKLNPALNYEPRLIGARSKRNYFCVKTKSTCHLTTRAKNAMASLGGVGAIYSALVRNKMSNVYINAKGCYDDAVAGGYTGTFRKYMYGFIKSALDAKEATIDITTPNHHVSINNPWVFGGTGSDVNVSMEIIAKFFAQLNPNPIFFKIFVDNGVELIVLYDKLFAQQGMTWGQYIEESLWNIAQIFIASYYDNPLFIKYNGEDGQLSFEDDNVYAADIIVNNANYIATFGG